jgi:hypothetical protein
MKHVVVLPLVVFCMALSGGCAQQPRAREAVASTVAPQATVRENGTLAARLDARWSSAIVGMPVESSSGAKLGRVQEVIVDGYGRPAFAILSYGGIVAGLGAKYAAVPWETVAEMLDRDRLVMSQSVLERAPALAGADADARNGAWRHDAERYWNGRVALAR